MGAPDLSPWAPALEFLMFPRQYDPTLGDREGPFLIRGDSETAARQSVRPGLAPGPPSHLRGLSSALRHLQAASPSRAPPRGGVAALRTAPFPPGGVRFPASPRGNAHGAGQPRGAGVIRAGRNELFSTKSPRIPGSRSRYAGVASTPSSFRGSFPEGGSERGELWM